MLYQALLIAKVVLVLAMIGLAAINRHVFVPAIRNNGPGLERTAWGTIAEIVLTAGVLALVSVLGAIAPT